MTYTQIQQAFFALFLLVFLALGFLVDPYAAIIWLGGNLVGAMFSAAYALAQRAGEVE